MANHKSAKKRSRQTLKRNIVKENIDVLISESIHYHFFEKKDIYIWEDIIIFGVNLNLKCLIKRI